MENKILVVDVNCIMPELKGNPNDEIQKHFEKEYNCKVLLIDTSRVNINGQSVNNSPIYFA